MKLFIIALSQTGLAFIQVVLLFLVPLVLFGIVKLITKLLNRKKDAVMYYNRK